MEIIYANMVVALISLARSRLMIFCGLCAVLFARNNVLRKYMKPLSMVKITRATIIVSASLSYFIHHIHC